MACNRIIVVGGCKPITVAGSAKNNLTVSKVEQTIRVQKGSVITVNTGDVSALRSPFLAGVTINPYQVVVAFGMTVRPADVTDLTHAPNVVGISTTFANPGDSVEVVTAGRISFAGWSWDDSQPIVLGLTPGSIAQDDPELTDGAVFSIVLGNARDSDTIDLNIQQPILF